jgi:predicted ribosome quality control (RQC) complex YloA/Tae2 family protein
MNKLLIIALLTAAPAVFAVDRQLVDAVRQNFDAQQSAAIISQLNDAERQGLPLTALENKVREGLAKKVPAERIVAAVAQRRGNLTVAVSRSSPAEVNRTLFTIEREATLAAAAKNAGPLPEKTLQPKPDHASAVRRQDVRKPIKTALVKESPSVPDDARDAAIEPEKVMEKQLAKEEKSEEKAADKTADKALQKQEKALDKQEKALAKQEKALQKLEKKTEKALEKQLKSNKLDD